MRGKNTIIINGKLYDAVSGLPVAAPDPISRPQAPKPKPTKAFSDIGPAVAMNRPATTKSVRAASTAHRKVQKSQTLRRDILKHPAPATQSSMRRKPAVGHVSKSEMITKFAPHPQSINATHAPVKKVADTPKHAAAPVPVTKAVARTQPAAKKPALSSREHKQKLISERLASIDTSKRATEAPKVRRGFFAGRSRASSVVTACVALVILGGYLTYLNMPNLSVRVAAAQSGVAASFPTYRPDGYRFDGPVAYSPGEVTINFQANGGPQKFTVKQKNSGWDSQAVLDNYVSKKANNDYITSSESGLTIYTFDNKAAWVNKGIFYTIDGDAPLSSEQILRIASSM